MRQTLFRPEAAASLRPRLEGEVLALQPIAPRRLLAGALLMVGSALLVATQFSFSQRLTVVGALLPEAGLVTVVAPRAGDVTVLVAEGATVAPGTVLARLTPRVYHRDGQAVTKTETALLTERQQLAAAQTEDRVRLLADQLQHHQARERLLLSQQQAAEQGIGLAQQRATLAEVQVQRQRDLVGRGFVAPAAVTQLELAQLELAQLVNQAQQSAMAAQAELTAARARTRELEEALRTARREGQQRQTELAADALRIELADETAVVAPVAGQVATRLVQQAVVSAGAPLLTLAPPGPLYAQLLVPEALVAKLQPGQEVLLRLLGADPTEQAPLNGQLLSVSPGVANLPGGPAGSSQTGHLARVSLPPVAPGARPGARVEAAIVLERKTLWRWLWTPLLRAWHRLDPPTKEW